MRPLYPDGDASLVEIGERLEPFAVHRDIVGRIALYLRQVVEITKRRDCVLVDKYHKRVERERKVSHEFEALELF